MPQRTNPQILQLCLRRYAQGESIHKIAADAELSVRTIYRAQRSLRVYGSLFQPVAVLRSPREIDDQVLEVCVEYLYFETLC